jgi:hypothetical protein
MDDDALDAIIDAISPVLGLTIAAEWRAAIRTHLRITLAHAETVAAFPLPDALDPAPVFAA